MLMPKCATITRYVPFPTSNFNPPRSTLHAPINRYRPETCCIVGNYYSLRGQHEKVRARAKDACARVVRGVG